MSEPVKTAVLDTVRRLSAAGIAGGVKIIPSFASSAMPQPLKKPVIAVGVKTISQTAGAMGGYLGSGGLSGEGVVSGEAFGYKLCVTLLLSIYLPAGTGAGNPAPGGSELLRIYSETADCLLSDSALMIRFHTTGAGGITYDDRGALRLDMTADGILYTGQFKELPAFNDIHLTRKDNNI